MVHRLLLPLLVLLASLASGPLEWELRPANGCPAEDCCCVEVSSCCASGAAERGPVWNAGCGCGEHDGLVIHVLVDPLAPLAERSERWRVPRAPDAGRPTASMGAKRAAPEPPPPRHG